MAKIHTHYDNLKVARLAPQEVIRAAYKALSQKYHPDKNPGDEKAARIMAILNTAYGILGEPARRREHDEWIAAEEWEIEWLESTRADDAHKLRGAPLAPAAEAHPVGPPTPYRVARDPKWWFGLTACFAAGWVAGLLLTEPLKLLPVALVSVLNGAAVGPRAAPVGPAAAPRPEPGIDSWAVSKADLPEGSAPPPDIKTLAVFQLAVPAHAPGCESELQTLVAPNGESWPASSGNVDGYPVGNPGDEMQVTIDNSGNGAAVFVKLFDLDRRANVRHAYVLAHDTLSIDKLAAAKYEVRYQNIAPVGATAECASRSKAALKQAVVGP
jgi:hypothetical protein